MRVSTMGRLAAAAALACSVSLAAAGGASAAPPRWSMTEVNLPSVVHNGSNAGYQVTIANAGPSNISTLYLVTRTTASPVYVVPDPTHGTCTQASQGPLKCSFGAVNAGDSVTVTVAYRTPTSGTSFDPVFQGNSNGATFSDSKNTSHGDTLQTATPQPTTLTSSKNFGGGFDVDGGVVSTDTSLSKTNIQATSVTPPVPAVVATVEDNPSGTTDCTGCTGTLLGEWARVSVGDGGAFPGSPLFPISVLIYGKSISLPPGAKLSDPAVLATFGMVHVLDGGAVVQLTDRCPAGDPSLNCVTTQVVGGNLLITGWVDENGKVRGVG
jgi:hypothetical protein